MSELVLFDFDGVLCDSLELSIAIVNELSREYGFRPLAEEARHLGSRELIKWLGIPWWKLPFVLRAARRRMSDRAGDLRLFAGARECLVDLKARGARVGVVTTNTARVVRAFDLPLDVLVADVSLFGKARVLRRLARGADRTVYVGDETRDVEAARAAGVGSAVVLWGYAQPQQLRSAQPDVVCADWDSLKLHLADVRVDL